MNLYESISNFKESSHDTVLAIECRRTGYGPEQVANASMTVGELIRELEQYDSNMKVVTSHDDGYTYGPLDSSDFREEEPDYDDDEEIEDSEKVNKSTCKTKEGEQPTIFKCPKCGKEISKEDLDKYGMCKACYEASLKENCNKEDK